MANEHKEIYSELPNFIVYQNDITINASNFTTNLIKLEDSNTNLLENEDSDIYDLIFNNHTGIFVCTLIKKGAINAKKLEEILKATKGMAFLFYDSKKKHYILTATLLRENFIKWFNSNFEIVFVDIDQLMQKKKIEWLKLIDCVHHAANFENE